MALDFEIKETYNPEIFILYDLSDWTGLGDAEVSILPPECETPQVLSINKNQINTFLPEQFDEIETDYFPDGIYEIEIKDAGDTESTTKNHLRVTRILNNIDKQFVLCVDKCKELTEEFRNRIYDLNLYIDASKAHLRNGITDKATYFFKTALKDSEYLEECKTCK